jgi:preprotein translocase SecE subunit
MSQVMEVKLKKNSRRLERKKQFFTWIGELKEELKKINWTTRAELIFCTKVVLWSTLLFGLGIYVIDLVIKGALELIKWILLAPFS